MGREAGSCGWTLSFLLSFGRGLGTFGAAACQCLWTIACEVSMTTSHGSVSYITPYGCLMIVDRKQIVNM